MALDKERLKDIKECAKKVVDSIRKITELAFNKENYHKSGRSGFHGKKFNLISTAIINKKNDLTYLASTKCFDNIEEKKVVVSEFEKFSKMYQKRAKSINHKL